MSEVEMSSAYADITDEVRVLIALYRLENESSNYRVRIHYPESEKSGYFDFNDEKHANTIQKFINENKIISSFELTQLTHYLTQNNVVSSETLEEFWQWRPNVEENDSSNILNNKIILAIQTKYPSGPELYDELANADPNRGDKFFSDKKPLTKIQPAPAAMASATPSIQTLDSELIDAIKATMVRQNINPEKLQFSARSYILITITCTPEIAESFKTFLEQNKITFSSSTDPNKFEVYKSSLLAFVRQQDQKNNLKPLPPTS